MWTDKEAAAATGGKTQGAWQAGRVEIDSRRVVKGDLFVAIKGERFDGHQFVSNAFERGAVAAMVHRMPENLPGDAKLLTVAGTLKGLEALATAARARSGAKIVGVTGSVGKTSAKEMLRLALEPHGGAHVSRGNYNNHIGLPLSLSNLPRDAAFAVFELGMNHAGEIAHLTHIARPDVAVITGIDAVHLEFFKNVEAIADAKAEIFEGMDADGVAVLNADNPHTPRLRKVAEKRGIKHIVTCGEAQDAQCRLIHYRTTGEGCAIEASIHGRPVAFTLSAIGRHWAQTALFALAVADALSLDLAKTAKALAAFSEPEGRGRVTRVGGALVIDDSYNASPASMRAAFAKTAEVWQASGGKGRKLAALGEMLELGEDAPTLHAALAGPLKEAGFDAVYTAGGLMKHLHEALPPGIRAEHAARAADLLPALQDALKPNDVLLIKGSHGSLMHVLAKNILENVPSPAAPGRGFPLPRAGEG